jgi:hypothetical protein
MRTFTGVCALIGLLALTANACAQQPAAQPSAAEQAAIFKAAGFQIEHGKYTRCPGDPSASHSYGEIRMEDLNGDGRPEAWATEGSVFCWGNTAESFVLLQKTPAGAWTPILDEIGIAVTQETKHRGWPDIEVGGPGMGPFPIYHFNGTKYVS